MGSVSTYLIDYENTSHHGLDGFKKLSSDDTVVIFLGAKNTSSSMPIDLVRELTANRDAPYLLWKRSKKTSKNYLDMQLVSYLGSLIGDAAVTETEYVIVSKDRDFEAAIDFWADRRKEISISLRPAISTAQQRTAAKAPLAASTTEATKRAVRNAVKDLGLKPSEYSAIYCALAASQSSQELHDMLARSIGANGQKVYPLVKSIHSQTETRTHLSNT